MASSYIDYIKKQEQLKNVFPVNIQDTTDILKNITSLMYEFKDSTVELNYNLNGEGGMYTKYISPLFYDKVINNPSNLSVIDIIGSFVPYYYLEPNNEILSADDVILQETRDLGINDVPSPLQNNDFYSTWFRETWGFIQNNIILDAYNKLRYPYINENQYLNTTLFPKISENVFNTESGSDSESYIEFLDTEEENNEVYDDDYPFKGEEIGCLDYIDNIVAQKILANYEIIDYENKQNVILNKWGESLYESGQIDSGELDTSKTIFKLQDIKNELLRRKFAGSRTLYDLAIGSVNRQGSFVTAIKYYNLPEQTIKKDGSYNNKRVIRVLKLPGIISQPYDYANNLGLDLFEAYLKEDSIPIDTLVPLFYTSADINYNLTSEAKFDNELFFSGSACGPENIKNYFNYEDIFPVALDNLAAYQSVFLRDNSNIIDWSSLDGVILSNNINEKFETLDSRYVNELGDILFRTLDSEYSQYSREEAEQYIGKKRDYSTKFRLDIKTKVLDLNLISDSVADINADKVLYHYNSIQQLMGSDYPYVTYPIAKGNGLSLIDTYWIDYIEKEIRAKSKVQDNTEIGTQLNTILKVNSGSSIRTGEHYFFGISFTGEDEESLDWNNIVIRDYTYGDKYALLWYCVLTYDADSFKVISVDKTLISKITLRINANDVSDKYKETIYDASGNAYKRVIKDYEDFIYYNIGILPFTYSVAKNRQVWENKIGSFISEEGEQEFINDTKAHGFSNAYFVFSDSNITKDCSDINSDLVNKDSATRRITSSKDLGEGFNYCSINPSKSTRTVYYVINKPSIDEYRVLDNNSTVKYDDEGRSIIDRTDLTDHYYWSDPVSVIHLTDAYLSDLKDSYFEPEWYKLGYFYNAYLNFTKNSASQLRHKFVLPSESFKDLKSKVQIEIAGGEDNIVYDDEGNLLYILNPGENTALSNLNRTRGMDFVCNDDGKFPTLWLKDIETSIPAKYVEGMYLSRVCPDAGDVFIVDKNREYSSVFGDNRKRDAFDYLYTKTLIYQGIERIDDLPNPPEAEDRGALFIVTFRVDLLNYRYFVWSSEDQNYREISALDVEGRSKLYKDDMGMRGINITSDNYFDNSSEGTPSPRNTGKWWANFFIMKPSQTEYPWYWNTESNGKTLFFNLKIDKDCLGDGRGFTLFSSKDSNSNNLMKLEVTGNGKVIFNVKGNIVESDEIIVSGNEGPDVKYNINYSNIRIASSLVEDGYGRYVLFLGVNDAFYESDPFDLDLEDTSLISLLSEYQGSLDWGERNYPDPNDTTWSQTGVFYGVVYDMRLYNCGKSLPELILLNQGSLRELYSYAPSNYKLAQTIYRDSAVLKKCNIDNTEEDTSLPDIYAIRIFDRSVWDSIIVDNCIVTTMETSISSLQYREDFINPVSDADVYKKITDESGSIQYVLNNCVEQDLIEDIEVFNGLSSKITGSDNMTILYQSAAERKNIQFNNDFPTTIVTALIEPGDYENDSLKSNNIEFYLDKDNKYISQRLLPGEPIYIPVQSDLSDDYFTYSADIDFNFNLHSDFDISKWLSRGTNISLEYNYALDKAVARLTDISLRDSESNHIILPFIVPSNNLDNSENDSEKNLYLDRFYAKDLVLSNSLSAFLNASSYYNEIQIPVAIENDIVSYDDINNGQESDKKKYVFNNTTDINPQPNKTYFYTTDESGIIDIYSDLTKKYRLAYRKDVIVPSSVSTTLYIEKDSYSSLYQFDADKTCVVVRIEGIDRYQKISTGEIIPVGEESNYKTIQVKVEIDGEGRWEELELDNLYFYDGFTYRYSDSSPISSGESTFTIVPGTMYKKYSSQEDYSLGLYKYEVYSDYYSLYEDYIPQVIDQNDYLTPGAIYFYKENDTYKKVEYKTVMGYETGSTFSRDIVYYEDHITENFYYCIKDGEYVFTNVAYPNVTTFTEWYNNESTQDISIFIKNDLFKPIYYNKWDALRIMKEGTYYFTCKYPMQILPFTDDQFDSSPDLNNTTYYASCRFKIVVKGTPTEFSDKNNIIGYPKKYWMENIENTLKSSEQRYLDDDNRTFPHRQIDIDLYVMDVDGIAGKMGENSAEEYSFKWVLIASNHSDDASVKLLNKSVVENQITLESSIPFFLEKNYLSPFFIAKYDKEDEISESDPESADDDIISPISISSNKKIEKIISESEDDMDNQIVISGRSYKVLFDYTAKLTELSFIDKIYDSLTFGDGSEEKINFSRLVNLLDTTTLDVSEYMYNTDGQSYQKDDIHVFYRNSGFRTSGSNWEDISTSLDDDYFSFGNPYSRASDLNYLLKIRRYSLDVTTSIKKISSRTNINNSFTFPYMVQQNESSTTIPASLVNLGVVVNDTGAFRDIENFDEVSVIKSHYNDIRGKMTSAISALKSQSCGLFLGMTSFTPNFVGDLSGISYCENINRDEYDLYGYYASSRLLKVRNSSIFIERRNLYSNDLLSNNDFEDKQYWTLDGSSSFEYIPDDSWGEGKDVFRIYPQINYSEKVVRIRYMAGDLTLNSRYEAAICIKKSLGASAVKAIFYDGDTEVSRINLSNKKKIYNTWYNYSNETDDSIVADSVCFEITYPNNVDYIDITKAVIRKCNISSHYLGLSNVINQVTSSSSDSKIISTSHNMVVYKNKETGEYFPIQFNNEIMTTISSNGKSVKRPKSGLSAASEFISKYNLGSYSSDSRLIKLYSPWIRKFYYHSHHTSDDTSTIDKGTCIIHKYSVKSNSIGKREVVEINSNVSDIFDISGCEIQTIKNANGNKYELLFKKLPLDIDDNLHLNYFNMNLSIDENNPIVLVNERFSSLFNCLDPERFREGKEYQVAVTNIQLLSMSGSESSLSYKKSKVVYELEYLPVIYREKNNHLSLNLMLYKSNSNF